MAEGKPLFGFMFPREGAERLAEAFARERINQPEAPLVPELQVVLSHLLPAVEERQAAIRSGGALELAIPVEEKLQEEIRDALARHLTRALDRFFPVGRDASHARLGRTRAMLALEHLADAEGRRGEGLDRAELVAMLGQDGETILDRLASAESRLVVEANGRCALSHDRLAEVVINLLRNEAARGALILEPDLIDLQRKISQKETLFASDPNDVGALSLSRRQCRLVELNRDTLLFDEGRKSWWKAIKRRHHRHSILATASAAFFLVAAGLLAWLFPPETQIRTEVIPLVNAQWTVRGNHAIANTASGSLVLWNMNKTWIERSSYSVECIEFVVGSSEIGCLRSDGRLHIWQIDDDINLEAGLVMTFQRKFIEQGFRPELVFGTRAGEAAFKLGNGGIFVLENTVSYISGVHGYEELPFEIEPIREKHPKGWFFRRYDSKDGASTMMVSRRSIYWDDLGRILVFESDLQVATTRGTQLLAFTDMEIIRATQTLSLWGIHLWDIEWPKFEGPLAVELPH